MGSSVQSKMARGALWMILMTWVERSLGFVSMMVLARILTPADFGISGMASSFIFMAQMFSAFGFDVVLIQKQDSSELHYHTAWTINVIVAIAILMGMIAAASPIARFYNQPEVLPVVCVLAFCPLIAACENIGVVAFRKDLDFRKEFRFQISRKLVGFLVTMLLAFSLRSYWALVGGMVAARLSGTITSYFVHPFRPRFSLAEVKNLVGFSKWLLISNLLIFLKERASDFVIGRFSGPASLGIYNISYELAYLPCTEIAAPINRALMPGFAKLAASEAVRSAYAQAVAILAVVAIPACAGIAAVAPFLVRVMLGEKWIDAVPLMEILAISAIFFTFQSSICALLIGRGQLAAVTKAHAVFVAVLLVALAALALEYGVQGAAYAALITTSSMMPVYLYPLWRLEGIPMQTFVRAVSRPVLATIAMVAVVRTSLPASQELVPIGPAVGWLAFGVILGICTYGVGLLLLWWIAGKPVGAERTILGKCKSRLDEILRLRRNQA